MRMLLALIVVAAGVMGVDAIAAGSGQSASPASLSGTASDATGHALRNTVVQLRNISSGQLAGRTTTNAAGQFSFAGLPPGTYVVEATNAAGQIVGTSGTVPVSAGAAMTGVGVTASALASVAAPGFIASHSVALIAGAAAAGVAGTIAAASGGTASPSQ